MSRIINQNTEPLFIFDMPDDEVLSQTISVKGEKGERGDPTKLSDLENDAGFITASTSALTNYYSKTESDTALNAKLDKTTFNAYEIPSDFFTAADIVSGTGTNIALANTARSIFKNITITGNATQSGTPTPDSPIDIDIVTGEQVIAITGDDTQSYTVDLGDIELCAIGDAKDYIYKSGERWYIHKSIGKSDLKTDATNWMRIGTSTSGNYRFGVKVSQTDVPFISDSSATPTTAICNYFVVGSRGSTYSRIEKLALAEKADSSTYLTFNMYIDSLKTDTVDSFKTWLQNNEVVVYYESTTPSEIEITDIALIAQLNALESAHAYLGTTTIAVTGDLAAPLTVAAFKNGWGGTVSGISNEFDAKANKVDLLLRPYYFDSVADMKKSNLAVGKYAITSGYYAYGDGGGGEYRIVDNGELVDDGGAIHALNNGLKAVLIVRDDTVNVRQFGAKGDGTTDDSTAIKNALAFKGNSKSVVEFIGGDTYVMRGHINIYSNTDVRLLGATIKSAASTVFINTKESAATAGYGAITNFNVSGGTFEGSSNGGVAFNLFHALGCSFSDITFNDCFVVTHIFDLAGCKSIHIKNCNFVGNLLTNASDNYREVIQPDYATHTSFPAWDDDGSVAYDGIATDGLTVDGCTFKKNDGDAYYLNGVGTHSIGTDAHNNIVVKNCTFYGCEYANIRLPRATNVVIDNNTFYGIRSDRSGFHCAINLITLTSSSLPIVASKNITISNNAYVSTLTEDDQCFIGVKGYDIDNPTDNVSIKNNSYNGVAVSETGYTGQDFANIGYANDVAVTGNKIVKAKHCVYKDTSRTLNNLRFTNNICDNCLRILRGGGGSTDTTNRPSGLVVDDNIIQTPLGTLNASSSIIELGLNEDVTLSGGSDVLVPLVVKSGYPLAASDDGYYVPSFIRKFRLTGHINAKTSSGQSIRWVKLRYRDMASNTLYQFPIIYEVEASGNAGRTVSLDECAVADDSLLYYYGTSRPWADGRYSISVQIRTSDTVTISADKTKIILEAF